MSHDVVLYNFYLGTRIYWLARVCEECCVYLVLCLVVRLKA